MFVGMLDGWWVLPNNQYSVAQREALVGIVGTRRVECSAADGDVRRGGDDPADILVAAVPQFHAERQSRGNVVQGGVRQFAKQSVDTVIEPGGATPKLATLGAKLLDKAEGVKLALAV